MNSAAGLKILLHILLAAGTHSKAPRTRIPSLAPVAPTPGSSAPSGSDYPSFSPSASIGPSASSIPSISPSNSMGPSMWPSRRPSVISAVPSQQPTTTASTSIAPSNMPSAKLNATIGPSRVPSPKPSPTRAPSKVPSVLSSVNPFTISSAAPTRDLSEVMSILPSIQPVLSILLPSPTNGSASPSLQPTSPPTAPNLGSISGNVSEDTNGDLEGDVGLEDVIILLEDMNGNSVTTLTDSNGDYYFYDLPPSTYTITEFNLDSGELDVSDSDGGDPNMITVTLSGSQHSGENKFVDATCRYVMGSVMEDTDYDDIGDKPIPKVTVKLHALSDDGEYLSCRTRVTDCDGMFDFGCLPAGKYTLVEINADGFIDLSDSDGGNPNKIAIDITSESSVSNEFVDTRSFQGHYNMAPVDAPVAPTTPAPITPVPITSAPIALFTQTQAPITPVPLAPVHQEPVVAPPLPISNDRTSGSSPDMYYHTYITSPVKIYDPPGESPVKYYHTPVPAPVKIYRKPTQSPIKYYHNYDLAL